MGMTWLGACLSTFLLSAGAWKAGRIFDRRLGLGVPASSVANLLIGLCPALAYETAMSVLFVSGALHPGPWGHLPKWIFGVLGLLAIADSVRDRVWRPYQWSQETWVFLLAALLFIPAFLIPPALHPSWDSDAVQFWLPKTLHIVRSGHLVAERSLFHPDYFSFANRAMGHLLVPIDGPAALSVLRMLSLGIVLWAVGDLGKPWPRFLRLAFLAILLNGFPLKWVNGYQDHWLALFMMSYFAAVIRSQSSEAVLYLGLMASSKNEGLALAAVCFVMLPRKTWQHLTALGALALPVLSWKILSRLQGLANSDLALRGVDVETMMSRLSTWFWRWAQALGRAFQSSWLDGLLAAFVLGIQRSLLSRRDWVLVAIAFFAIVLPQAVVLFTPKNYSWHLETTFSRVSAAGLLSLVFLAFQTFAGENRPSQSP